MIRSLSFTSTNFIVYENYYFITSPMLAQVFGLIETTITFSNILEVSRTVLIVSYI